jgi:hypothetical protein
MFINSLKPGKWPTTLTIGAIFIFLYVFVVNILTCSANAAVFSINFKEKTLPKAMEILSEKAQTKITLIGDMESTAAKSIKIESQSLSKIIQTTLKRYGVDNYAIIYEDKADVIKIRLGRSRSSKENIFYPALQSDENIVNGKLTSTRMFSDQDFTRLLEKDRVKSQENEFSEEDFMRLLEKNVAMTQHREFSNADFLTLAQQTEIKQYPTFSSDDFAGLSEKSDLKVEHKQFSDEDFTNVLNNEKKEN